VPRMVGAPSGPPDGRIDSGEAKPTRRPETYRSSLALVAWWVWLLFAVANLIDLAVQGRDRTSVEAAAVLVLVTGIAYVGALRPRVTAAAGGIVVRNPLRDHRAPWLAVTNVDLRDLLRVHCAWQEPANKGQELQAVPRPESVQRTRVIQAWAIQSPRRAATVTAMRPSFGRDYVARRSVGGGAAAAEAPGAVHRKECERIARALAERARREHADAAAPGTREAPGAYEAGENGAGRKGRRQTSGPIAGNGPEWPARPVSAWNWPAVLAIAVPLLLLVATILR
jgi:hypothetical protein